jgi:hypothetical protein
MRKMMLLLPWVRLGGRERRPKKPNLRRAKEGVRRGWIAPGLESVAQYLRFAFRSLRRTPLFTGVAVLSVALGIGAASTVFSLLDGVPLKPLSYRDSGSLCTCGNWCLSCQVFIPHCR